MSTEVSSGEVCNLAVAPGQFLDIGIKDRPLVASLYAFLQDDPQEWLSVGNTRIMLGTLRPRAGDCLFSNRRRALFVWVADSTGVHDLIMPFGAGGGGSGTSPRDAPHVLANFGTVAGRQPDPLNLFMHTRIGEAGRIHLLSPAVRPGDHVVLRSTAALCCVVLPWPAADMRARERGTLAVSVSNNKPPQPQG